MKTLSFYRKPSNKGAPQEDAYFLNHFAELFGVADGVSQAYSPSNPPVLYDGRTSGQVASACFAFAGMRSTNIEGLISLASENLYSMHRSHGRSRQTDDVGAACFAACALSQDMINVLIAGDCFVLTKERTGGYRYLSGFDDACTRMHAEAEAACTACKEIALSADPDAWERYFPAYMDSIGNVTHAMANAAKDDYFRYKAVAVSGGKVSMWDLYYHIFRARKMRTHNVNMGQGGHAVLNGDSRALECATRFSAPRDNTQWILIGTDGMMPSLAKDLSVEHLVAAYEVGGFDGLCRYRDANENLPHMAAADHPEGTAIAIHF